MKRIFLAMMLFMFSIFAFAAPSPQQVERALAARDYNTAKMMIGQVLAENPSSARAHLLNAYVLAAADRNRQAAQNELNMVRSLDRKGDVVNSPLFGRTVGAINSIPAAAPQWQAPPVAAYVPPPVYAQPAPAYVAPAPTYVAPVRQAAPVQQSESHWFLWTVLFGLIIGVIAWWFFRRNGSSTDSYSTTYSSPSPSPAPSPASSRGFGPRTAYYPPETNTVVVRESNGMGVAAGVGAAVVGAVVIENAIENAELRGRVREMERERRYDNSFSSGSGNNYGNTGYVPAPTYVAPAPTYEPSQVDSESEAQSFSSSSSQSSSWNNDDDSRSNSSSSSSSNDWGSNDPSPSTSNDNNWN